MKIKNILLLVVLFFIPVFAKADVEALIDYIWLADTEDDLYEGFLPGTPYVLVYVKDTSKWFVRAPGANNWLQTAPAYPFAVADTTGLQTALDAKIETTDFTWTNLSGKPSLFDGAYSSLSGKPTLFDGAYSSLSGKPTLFDGAYSSLTGKPTLFDGAYSSLTGAPSLAAVATAGTYASLTGKPTLFDGAYSSLTGKPTLFDGAYSSLTGKPTLFDGAYSSLTGAPAARSQSSVSHSLNACFQISSSRDSLVNYSVDIATTLSLTSGQTGTIFLEIYSDSSCTTGTQELSRTVNGNGGALTLGLNLTQNVTGTLTGYVPSGSYVKIRTANTVGTPTFTYRSGQEVLM